MGTPESQPAQTGSSGNAKGNGCPLEDSKSTDAVQVQQSPPAEGRPSPEQLASWTCPPDVVALPASTILQATFQTPDGNLSACAIPAWILQAYAPAPPPRAPISQDSYDQEFDENDYNEDRLDDESSAQ